jgi:hypothetical protein
MTHTYQLYGLTACSDLELPELLAYLPSDDDPSFDLHIQRGEVPEEGLKDGKQLGPYLHTDTRQFWLTVPEIARFLVRDGREIIYQPLDDIDEASVRVFMLGSCMGALLFQRGLLVLHGNAIRVGDGCVVCVGNSGTGKSTLAARFLQRGHQIISDDVCALNAAGEVIPGFPRIKLWQDVADKLSIKTEGLRRIRPEMEKYDYPLDEQFCQQPLPVLAIYILSPHNKESFELTPIRGMERFQPLRNHTYRMRYMEGMALQPQHLQMIGKLAGQIHLARLNRPNHGFDIDQLAELILEDLEAQRISA